jgi:hypothetical protein
MIIVFGAQTNGTSLRLLRFRFSFAKLRNESARLLAKNEQYNYSQQRIRLMTRLDPFR